MQILIINLALIEKYPAMDEHLSATSRLTQKPLFEAAVIKIQRGEELALSNSEKRAVKRFLLTPEDDSDEDDQEEEQQLTEVQRIMEASRKRKAENTGVCKSKYKSLKHCLTTSNIVERLFSRAKLILSERRKSMSPYHLELLLFLRSNQELWNDYTIQDCYDNPESLTHEDQVSDDDEA